MYRRNYPPAKQHKSSHFHSPLAPPNHLSSARHVAKGKGRERVEEDASTTPDPPEPLELPNIMNDPSQEVALQSSPIPMAQHDSQGSGSKRSYATYVAGHVLLEGTQTLEGLRQDESNPCEDAQIWTENDVTSGSDALVLSNPVERSEEEIPTPFIKEYKERYSGAERKEIVVKRSGAVDGYLKFSFNLPQHETHPFSNNFGQTTLGVHHRAAPSQGQQILPLPRGFASVKLDAMDQHFFRFCKCLRGVLCMFDPNSRRHEWEADARLEVDLNAFCRGRTLLLNTNLWYTDIAPMISKKECVKHALLALSAGYWLHFNKNEMILARANAHYEKAIELMTEEMKQPKCKKVGQDDGLVSAMLLLFIDDAVNYELRLEKGTEPRWRAGARTAHWLLSQSDPGQRYWKPSNIQCSTARTSNANFVAFVEILAQIVTPLTLEDTDEDFLWLLQGTEDETRKIHGGTGLCPKLLHIFTQITTLCARMWIQGASTLLPYGAHGLMDMLTNFRQTSDFSQGYPTTEALLRSCSLDEAGNVADKVKVTELTAESWVAVAKIYLLCRFFRKPRSHPDVQAHLATLLKCIGRMPCTGPLFTSQSPFLCVFVMCMISETEASRKVGREWFETVLGDSSNRSSVPPVWGAVQRLWTWFDTQFEEKEFDETQPIAERQAWWEEAIAMLVETEGYIPLY